VTNAPIKEIDPSYPPPQLFQAHWPEALPGWEERFGYYAIGPDDTVFLPAIAVLAFVGLAERDLPAP